MKCLSVRQPWADLLVRGPKDVENRTWSTTHRCWLLIHASKGKHPEEYMAARKKCHQLGCIDALASRTELAHGAIVGRVWLRRCDTAVSSPWHVPGQIGWYFDDRQHLEDPIEYSGQLGLYDVDPAVLAGAVFIDPKTGERHPYEKAAPDNRDLRPSRERKRRQSKSGDVHQSRPVPATHEEASAGGCPHGRSHQERRSPTAEAGRGSVPGQDGRGNGRAPQGDGQGARPVAWPRLESRATASMKRYLSVLHLAAAGELVDKQGRTWPDLTDAEAAAWLGKLYQAEADVERVRGLLMGKYADPLSLADRPVVRAERRRECRVSGEDALTYRISDKLYGFEPLPS